MQFSTSACLRLSLRAFLPLLLWACSDAASFGVDVEMSASLSKARSFLNRYCIECHGPKTQEADRRFDALTRSSVQANAIGKQNLELWHEVLDRINLADMPPEDAPLQPTDAERLAIGETLGEFLSNVETDRSSSQQTVLRRLNRPEYDAAIRSVLALDKMLAEPANDFVPDETENQFRNIGESLIISDVLLRQYLQASGQYLDHAIAKQGVLPERQTWKFQAPFFRERGQNDGLNRPGKYQHLRENPTYRNGYLWIEKFSEGVPASGYYKIRVKANAINRQHPYLDWIVDVPKEDPLLMGVVATHSAAKDLRTNDASDKTLAVFTMRDDQPQWFETTQWLDEGWTVRLTYPNGPAKIKYMRHSLMHKHPDLFPGFIRDRVHVFHDMHPDYDRQEGPKLAKAFLEEQDRLKKAGKPYDVFGIAHSIHTHEAWSQFYREYQGPRIRVYEIEVLGPFSKPNESEAEVAKFFPTTKLPMDSARNRIVEFAERAYRRPVHPNDVQPVIDHYSKQIMGGADQTAALKVAYQAILCSPAFLFHRTKSGTLDDHELANRLSYFLWSQPPDKQLSRLADQGDLSDPAVLEAQTNRLLDDPRHLRMIDEFIDAWLHLAKLGTMLPDRAEHPEYYNEQLEDAMRTETRLFVSDMLQRDVGISALIDSDYTFVNSSLARLYGIPNVEGHAFRRVSLENPMRGGLLGQASVLTASANGIDTSPVLRGVWVLECLLGTPPSPPPPDVEPIEPDTRGSKTIREQLSKHREVATCANCHRRIDPPGFALESFDEIGRFRDYYLLDGPWKRMGPKIDPSGLLPSGESFADVVELKQHLMPKLDLVTRNLAAKLLVHATGRSENAEDRADLLKLTRGLQKTKSPEEHLRRQQAHGPGMRTLVHAIVQSDAFRR